MSDSLSAESIRLRAHGGDEIEAYLTRPAGTSRRGGVVQIHHLPGYDRASKEMTRRFAELGYDAICPNLFGARHPAPPPTMRPLRSSPSTGPPTGSRPPTTAGSGSPPSSRST